MFQREAGGVDGLAVGGDALRNVLVHALGVGDKSGGVAACADFLADARPGRKRRARPWIQFGLLWGIAALANTSLLAFLPASGLYAWYRRWKRGKPSLAGVVLSALIFAACIAPWMARNYRTLGVMSLRSNFGAELRIGNGPGADGTWREYLHPTQNVYQMRLYREMGEVAYVKERERQAVDFIREDYPRFMVLCLKRFIYYWAGVPRLSEIPALAPLKNSVFLASSVLAFWGLGRALRKRRPGAWLFLLADSVVPGGVLRGFPASALSPSHRAGTGNSDGVRDF